MFGAFYEGNEGWKFFLDKEHWPGLWARRLENPPSTLLLRTYAACRGARGATNPRVASLRKELPHAADGGPTGNLAGVARLGGRNVDLVRKSVTRGGDAKWRTIREATASAMKFSGAYSHRTLEGGIGHDFPREAPDTYADAEVGGGRGT